MVCPDNEAERADRDERPNHWQVAKHRLARECREDVRDKAKAWKNHDIDFWVTEEPENVLVKDRIAATCWVKEGCPEVAVREEHRDCASQNRQGKEDEPRGDEDRPSEEWYFEQCHAWCAHVEESGDHVDRAKDRACARNVNREDRQIHRHAAFID